MVKSSSTVIAAETSEGVGRHLKLNHVEVQEAGEQNEVFLFLHAAWV